MIRMIRRLIKCFRQWKEGRAERETQEMLSQGK